MSSDRPKDFEEVTLALALLGGIIVVIMEIIDYVNNNSIDAEGGFKPLVIGLMGFLLIELLIIFLFFIFKGVSIYANDGRKEKFKHIAEELFKASYVGAFVWFIDSIVIVGLKSFTSQQGEILYFYILIFSIVAILPWYKTEIENWYKIENLLKNKPYKSIKVSIILFILLLFISFSISLDLLDLHLKEYFIYYGLLSTIIAIWSSNTKTIDIWCSNTNSEKLIKILVVFFIIILSFLPIEIYEIAPQYLLTGSYSIEEYSPSIDNPDILTFTMKEKGIKYEITDLKLIKLNNSDVWNKKSWEFSNEAKIDNEIAYRDNTQTEKSSCYLWVRTVNSVWYLNVINISNLSSGTYLLNAIVTNNLIDNSTGKYSKRDSTGISKRIADKLIYIPPEKAKANYSFDCTP